MPRSDPSDPEWSICADALREHRIQDAAEIYHNIQEHHGFVTATDEVYILLRELPADLWIEFHSLT